MNIKVNDIKAKMEELYQYYIEDGDKSYFDLWHSLRTLRSLNLMDDVTWTRIYDFDHKLFEKYS